MLSIELNAGKLFLLSISLNLIVLFVGASNFYEPDRIRKLPGLNASINFEHFSGYLNATGQHQLFYWFVTSQSAPSTDPLLLWLNGGPGCSPMEGLLKELGPYLINPDGRTLRLNPHSWNRNASVLFLEGPVGTGFSRSTNRRENLTWSDDETSLDMYTALKHFYTKFPTFRRNQFFISGESYAGIYLPTLAKRILDGQANYSIKLQGMAIGNGYMNSTLLQYTNIEYGYSHGILAEDSWTQFLQQCNTINIDNCDFNIVNNLSWTFVPDDLYIYNIYGNCAIGPELERHVTWACDNFTDMWTYFNNDNVRKALHVTDNTSQLTWEDCSDTVSNNYDQQYWNGVEELFKQLIGKMRILLFFGDTDMRCDFLMGRKFSDRLGKKLLQSKQPWYSGGQIAGLKSVYEGFTFTTIRGAGHMVPETKPAEIFYAINAFMKNGTL